MPQVALPEDIESVIQMLLLLLLKPEISELSNL